MPEPLLCELHAHTTWSDGVLTPAELVDLYGRCGFDVLAVTDHVVRNGYGGGLAVLLAAHPYRLGDLGMTSRTTARWPEEAYWAAAVVDRFESISRPGRRCSR